jgi:hypothetical protein
MLDFAVFVYHQLTVYGYFCVQFDDFFRKFPSFEVVFVDNPTLTTIVNGILYEDRLYMHKGYATNTVQ